MQITRCKYFLGLFFFCCAFSVTAQIPGATQQPQWSMALYFVEAGGAKDTLYAGYDPDADFQLALADTIYGERKIPVDTLAFNVKWNDFCVGSPICDSLYKVNVSSLWLNAFPLPGNGTILFQNGNLPLQISWNVNLFHSDSLPFSDQDPLPRAQGNLYYSFAYYSAQIDGNWLFCQSGNDVILVSDTSYQSCWAKDSVTLAQLFGPPTSSLMDGNLRLQIVPWTGMILGIDDNVDRKENFLVYPNPATSELQIQNAEFEIEFVAIYDVLGQRVLSQEPTASSQQLFIDVSALKSGIYFVKVRGEKEARTAKFVKQ